MKKLASVFLLLSFHSMLGQRWAPGEYLDEALTATFSKANIVVESTEYGFMDNVCVLGAFLEVSEEVGWNTYFYQGNDYLIIGGGDTDADDVDLEILDMNGVVIHKDTEDDNTPILKFTPRTSGKYQIKLKLYSGSPSFCAVAFLERGGNRIPENNVTSCIRNVVSTGREVNELVEDAGASGLKFHDLGNSWCAYGAVLRNSEELTISNIYLGSELHSILAVGDVNTSDIDIELKDKYDRIVATDSDSSKEAVVSVEADDAQRYSLTIENYESSGKSFIFTTVFTVVP